MNACEMVATCLRRQQPELFGRDACAEGIVPTELRYGRDSVEYGSAPTIPEEPMGAPDHRPLYEPVVYG